MKNYIRYERKGSTELIDAKRIESEVLRVKIDGQKKYIYLGVYPQVMERKGFLGVKRARLYFVREGEPFARDAYSGEYANEEKMWQAMLSNGAIDEFGLLMHDEEKRPYYGLGSEQTVISVEEYQQILEDLKKGEKPRANVFEKLQTLKSFLANYDRDLFTFEDVSKMEYLLEEALLLAEGKVAQGLTLSAKKAFMQARDIILILALIAPFVFSAFVVYANSGGF